MLANLVLPAKNPLMAGVKRADKVIRKLRKEVLADTKLSVEDIFVIICLCEFQEICENELLRKGKKLYFAKIHPRKFKRLNQNNR